MGNYYARSNGEIKWLNLWITAGCALGLLFAIILAGHEFGWWLRADSTNRDAQVNQQSYGYQQAQTQDLARLITTVNTINVQIAGAPADQQVALKAQRHAVVDQACAAAAQITTIPPAQTGWVAQNCADGAATPGGPNT
jgi:hypothetical protein